MTWFEIADDRHHQVDAKLAENANIARVLDEHASRTLRDADLALLNLKQQAEKGRPSPRL
ncbi:MAG: hypothetical protein ACKVQU_12350 [Burkholderiales bacterium]